MDKPNPFYALLRSRKFWVALGGIVSSVVVSLGVPEAKVTPIVASIVALAGLVIISLGYADGKSLEGTVPEGRQPAAPMQINVAATGPNVDGGGAGATSSNLPPKGPAPTMRTTASPPVTSTVTSRVTPLRPAVAPPVSRPT